MRARNIKPGFFTNPELGALSPITRILFQGLWCLADREGRLEDRPTKIKREILPGELEKFVPVNVLLDGLANRGLIIRYEANGKKYIAIPNFLRHQKPHRTEKPSTIPPPPETTPKVHLDHTSDTPKVHLDHTSDTPKMQPVENKRLAETNNALNPDSLNPDSLNPEVGVGRTKKFELTPEGLAQVWCFNCRRKKNRGPADLPEDIAESFISILAQGVDPEKILAEIKKPDGKDPDGRDRSEYFWQFKNRVLATVENNKPPGQNGKIGHMQRLDEILNSALDRKQNAQSGRLPKMG